MSCETNIYMAENRIALQGQETTGLYGSLLPFKCRLPRLLEKCDYLLKNGRNFVINLFEMEGIL